MGKRIYVGNLPWSVTRDRLLELFRPFGEIEEGLVIANKYTGRSRGFGFVTFKDEGAADKAIRGMHEKDVEGRKLVVREARPMRSEQESSEAITEKPMPEEPESKEPKEEKKEEPVKKPAKNKTRPVVVKLKKTSLRVAGLKKKSKPEENKEEKQEIFKQGAEFGV